MFEKIKKLAQRRGFNLKKVSSDLGFSENYFYTIKQGSQIPADRLAKVAEYFDVSTDYLLGRSDAPKWATKEDAIDIEKALKLNTTAISYDGIELTEDEKEKVDAIIKSVLWDKLKEKKEG